MAIVCLPLTGDWLSTPAENQIIPRNEAYKYLLSLGEILMKLLRYTIVGACALLLMVSSKPACAIQVFSGRVTGIELTYMPGSVRFFLDNGNAACPAGTALYWQNANVENNKVVYAALTTALASRQQIAFYINDNDQTCVGRFIYLRPA